ncbi:conserved hypothetical protein [Enterobacterales bacterium 8AC]|nr:conserved hypothetical protein [Enterobacterales bacterium 8AC]
MLIDLAALRKLLFPAPAGMNRVGAEKCRKHGTIPRASGDEPFDGLIKLVQRTYSPRQRG